MNKEKARENLKKELDSRRFAEWFSDDGEFGKYVMGAFERNSDEDALNKKKVNQFVDELIERILK